MTSAQQKALWKPAMWIGLLVIAALGGKAVAWWKTDHQDELKRERAIAFEKEWRTRIAPAPGRAEFVSAEELIANPEKYDGRRVILRGVWSEGFEHSSLGLGNREQNFSIWIDADWAKIDAPMGDFSNRLAVREGLQWDENYHTSVRVLAEGTFRYRKQEDQKQLTGFGHFGVSEAYFRIDRLFEYEAYAGETDQ